MGNQLLDITKIEGEWEDLYNYSINQLGKDIDTLTHVVMTLRQQTSVLESTNFYIPRSYQVNIKKPDTYLGLNVLLNDEGN